MFLDDANNRGNVISVNSEMSSESKLGFINPEPISKDTFLSSQYDREGRQLYTCYHSVTNHITVSCKFIFLFFKFVIKCYLFNMC